MPAVPFPHRTAMSLDNTALRSEHTDGTYTYIPVTMYTSIPYIPLPAVVCHGVDIVPNGGWANATKGGKDPGEEEAAAVLGTCGVFGNLLGGPSGDDGVGVGNGGGEVGGEEGAADGEVDGGGVLGEGGGEDEVDLGATGEGGVEVDCEGGVEVTLGAEVVGDAAGEFVVAAEAQGAAAAGELVVAVAAEEEEAVGGEERLGGVDGAAVGGAAEVGGCGGEGGRWDAKEVADVEGEFGVREEGTFGDALAEEEGGDAAEGAGADAGDGVGMGIGGEPLVFTNHNTGTP